MTIRDLKSLTEDEARQFFEDQLWKDGPICPHCGNCDPERIGRVKPNKAKRIREGLIQCKECRKQSTVTTNTVMHKTRLPLAYWAFAFAAMCSSKKGISAHQLRRELDVSYEAAWFMEHRIRLAMRLEPLADMLKGQIHADEAYIGGKPRNKGVSKRGRGTNKQPVATLVEYGGRSYTRVIPDNTRKTLQGNILSVVHRDSTIMSDENSGYTGIGKHFTGGHHSVNHHRDEYVKRLPDGTVVTSNSAESLFAIVKRSWYGIHHQYGKHLMQHYLDERDYVYSTRKMSDVERTMQAVSQGRGKRMMHRKGKGIEVVIPEA